MPIDQGFLCEYNPSSQPVKIHWRGGRVVECGGLENRYTRKGIGGSNPSLSASF